MSPKTQHVAVKCMASGVMEPSQLGSRTQDSDFQKSAVLDHDHYATHLGAINGKNAVIAAQDILNERGVLLAKQGSRIDPALAQKLVQHRLTKPLDTQVELSQTITIEAIQKGFNTLLGRYTDVHSIHLNLKFQHDFDLLLRGWRPHPILAQKLTVFQDRMPIEFEKALFSAWFSALLAREMGLDVSKQRAVMLGGLLHDVGFLHIDPTVLHKVAELSPAEWRAIQSHTVIGKTMCASIPDLDDRVPRIILEHHERCDGLGYPTGKLEDNLDALGQIVAMADAIQAIRVGKFARTGRTLRDLDSFLNMNSDVHFRCTYTGACGILRKSALPRSALPHCANPGWVEQLHARWLGLAKVISFLETLSAIVARIDVGTQRAKLQRVFTRTLVITHQSGLLTPEIGQWLKELRDNHLDATVQIELGDIEFMLDELSWQLRNTKRAVTALFEESSHPVSTNLIALKTMTEELSNALDIAV